MRMTRHLALALAIAPVLLLASCDPFDLVEPRQHRPVQRHPDHQRHLRDLDRDDHNQPRPEPDHRTEPDRRPVPERYPVAERTANPNQVISPYAPFNVIDITGYNSGQLVRDPSNNEIFRIP